MLTNFFEGMQHRVEALGPPIQKGAYRLDDHLCTIVHTLREIRDVLQDRDVYKNQEYNLVLATNNRTLPIHVPSGEDWAVQIISLDNSATFVEVSLGGKKLLTNISTVVGPLMVNGALILKGGGDYTITSTLQDTRVSFVVRVIPQSFQRKRRAWIGDTQPSMEVALRGQEPERREVEDAPPFSDQVPLGIGLTDDRSGLQDIQRQVPVRGRG